MDKSAYFVVYTSHGYIVDIRYGPEQGSTGILDLWDCKPQVVEGLR